MKRYYNEQLLNDISQRIDIVDIVSETIKLTRKGNRYWGLCPFHEEKTSSFSVTPDKNLFYCFGCHAGGNIFTYIMKRDGLDFTEAVEMLAGRAGVTLELSNRNRKEDGTRKRVLEVNQAAAQFFNQMLLSSQNKLAIDYIKGRGINLDTISQFQLGYALDSWNALEEYLLKKGYAQQYIKMSGLIKRSSNDRYYDLFRKRIVFPIGSYDGKVVGFGGRVMDDSLPKYLNTPETDIYSKRKHLYGLHQARETIRKENQVLLVEGYMDCIKMHQNGIKNCVATLGTAFTIEQGVLLRRYAEAVIIIYDGDEAGQRETVRTAQVLQEQDLKVEILTLPSGKDPDDYLELYGKEEFLRYIQNNKITYLEFKINKYINQAKEMNFEAQKTIINAVKGDINALQSEIEVDYYIKNLAQKLRLEQGLVYREVSSKKRDVLPISKNKSSKDRDNIEYGNYSLEEKILAAMLKDPGVYARIQNTIGIDFISDPGYRELISQCTHRGQLKQLVQVEDEKISSTAARLEFILEDIEEIDNVSIDNLIRQVAMTKAKRRQRILYHKLDILKTEGDFNSIMKFILEIDTILNETREGGYR
ncbi:MAG: DNA primase [Syntrophomonadaceae bacterium]|jgi:DNA primase|nr:DNA primase [Syntrophomonadaceae bacterium]